MHREKPYNSGPANLPRIKPQQQKTKKHVRTYICPVRFTQSCTIYIAATPRPSNLYWWLADREKKEKKKRRVSVHKYMYTVKVSAVYGIDKCESKEKRKRK